jgi:hypothetical protein
VLVLIGAGIHRKTTRAIAPPLYDAMSYYAKAWALWRAAETARVFNPLNVEPVVRPPGVVLLSGPLGFSPNFQWFFFRATFFPVVLFSAACWVAADEQRRSAGSTWLVASACAGLVTLPMFYHFEPSDVDAVSTYWGNVDSFLAGVSALGMALLLVGARRLSLLLTAAGSVAAAFTLMIKPAGLVVIPVLIWGWVSEALIAHRPVRVAWRDNRRFRAYVLRGGSVIVVVVGLTTLACMRSRYLSGETLRFFANSQHILRDMYRGVPLGRLIIPQVHPWFGWHWMIFFAALTAGSVLRGLRSSFAASDLRLAAAGISLGIGVAWWIWFAGPSETRYVLPFVLVFIVMTLPSFLSSVRRAPAWAQCLFCAVLVVPAALLVFLLWADRPPVPLQRLLGVGLATGQFRDEVAMGNIVTHAARSARRDLSMYALEADSAHGIVEAVGVYRQLVEPGRSFFFRTLGPYDWTRPPLIRRHDLLTSDYVLFRPINDAREVQRWASADPIDDRIAETQTIRAWLSGAGEQDGFEIVYAGSLRLARIVDVAAADRSFGELFSHHHWREMFDAENRQPVTVSQTDLEHARANSLVGTRDVNFGDKFRLLAVTVARTGAGVEVEILWENVAAEPGNWWAFVHVLGTADQMVLQADYPLRVVPRRGFVWRDRLVWSTSQLRGANRFGVGIYVPNREMLRADRGKRDWNSTRLLVDLPREP